MLDDFTAMLDESFGGAGGKIEGTVVKGRVMEIDSEEAVIDVGLKSEGRVALKEFAPQGGGAPEIKVGDTVEVYVERFENKTGEAVLSRDKAKREESWNRL
ncbi:MAG: S1 RNA-binding domain-containing protein, partial [Geminicoccaceae bacterium]|nr:S1 RNA-binding domain-containing protein [Geminicoccaceae bacterium]